MEFQASFPGPCGILAADKGPGPSFVAIGSVVCSISITGGRAHQCGPNNGTRRQLD